MQTEVAQQVIPDLYPDYPCDACGEDVNPSTSPQCDTCDRCGGCCECFECADCGTCDPNHYTECSTCDRCDSCCDCHFCNGCEENISSDDTICSVCDRCETCCDNNGVCWTCESCDRRYNDNECRCSACEACESCCECHGCVSCCEQTRPGNYCHSCERCHDCCNCDEGDNSETLTRGQLTFHTATKLEHKRNTSKRHISLELEISGDDGDGAGADYVKPVAESWNDAIVEDGSLPDSGYEINSNPSSGDVFIRHINELCSGLRSAGAKVDSSCGMHCHVAAPDYSYFDLFKLCKLYGTIEDGLFSMVSKSRRYSHRYTERCASRYRFGHYATFKADLIRELYGDEALTIQTNSWSNHKRPCVSHHRGKMRLTNKTEKYNSSRYCALNLHSFFYRGTIEFRHHQGTTMATKATNWGMVCAAIVDAASRLTIAQIDALPEGSFERLLAILPNDDLREYARERRNELS